MQELLVLPGTKHPRFATIEQLAHDEGVEQLDLLVECNGLVAKYGFAKVIEGLMSNRDSPPHLLSMISSVM